MSEKRIKVYKEETEREIKGIERENSVVNRVISPVQTVNGKSPDATGNIEIDNEDVGAPSTEDFSTLEETVRGKQDEIDVDNKLSADLVDDTESENKFVTAQEKNEWSGKQDELTAGDNITIENNVISAAGKAYTAGNGLTLEGTKFSADTTVLATKNDLSAKQDALS